jgi:ParB-like chromosome segregation protein Spo0J
LEDIRVEYISFEEIKKWPRNPKDHDHREIQKSFQRFGFVQPVLVDDESHHLVAGHGRLESLQLLKDSSKAPPKGIKVENGAWLVPVLRGVRFDNLKEAEAFLLSDNRLTEIGGWDEDILSEVLKGMAAEEVDMEGIGFSPDEIMDLINPKVKSTQKKFKKREDLTYSIVVTCKDEEEQSDLLERFMAEGIDCKGLVE